MKFYFISLVFIFTIVLSQEIDPPEAVTKVATCAANWLKIESGVKGISMGGSQVASGSGISGIFYNPASIAFTKSSEVYYSKSYYLAGISHNTLGYVTKISPSDYLGLYLFYLDSGEMEVTTVISPDGTGEMFNVLDLSVRFLYGKQLTDRLRIGAAVKYFREDIYTAQMQSLVIDLGSNFDTGMYGFILGMSVSNFGPEVQYEGDALDVTVDDDIAVAGKLSKITNKFPVPLTFRIGLSNDVIGGGGESVHRLTFSADAINPIDYTVYGGLGVEYSWRDIAFVRGGTRLYHDTAGLSLGGGLKWSMFAVDYAYVNYGILEETHQFGISLEF
mgnify:FL=1